MQKPMTFVVLAAACAAAGGCASFKQAVGAEKVAPDEFRVVTRAPLVMPPDYALRPPRPGDPRPQELRPGDQARAAVFGQDVGREASAGERLLIARADADAVDPTIRAQVDMEEANIVHKGDVFAASIISFGGSVDSATPLTPEEQEKRLAEQETIRRATGGGEVVIERKESRSKLPGL
jgi:hypothetical protein